MVKKRKNQPVQVASLFKGVLPEDYLHKRAIVQQYQHFFESQETDAVFQMVQVTNVTDQYLVVTLPNAALSSYLRLHSGQIRQLIIENFGVSLELKISTRPAVEKPHSKPAFNHGLIPEISHSSCEQIVNAADYVEDEELKNALKSLSRTLAKHAK